tara:strand:- start:243 stop:947 length:705 start_codon:yes stop_codon:yes gene_type:complete
MLDVILVSNYSMKEELEQSLKANNYKFHDLMIQDINHIERYPIDDEYKTIIIQSANAVKKIDSSNNHIYNAKYIYGIGPNCRTWVKRKFSLECIIPDHDYSSSGLIEKIRHDKCELGKTLLLKGIGGKTTIQNFLKSENLHYNVCNVYERILNEDNLHRVTEMIKDGAVVIGFSKSSVEPLLENSEINLDRVHFIVLDKSDEEIKCDKDVASITKLIDIYDIPDIVDKIKARVK